MIAVFEQIKPPRVTCERVNFCIMRYGTVPGATETRPYSVVRLPGLFTHLLSAMLAVMLIWHSHVLLCPVNVFLFRVVFPFLFCSLIIETTVIKQPAIVQRF